MHLIFENFYLYYFFQKYNIILQNLKTIKIFQNSQHIYSFTLIQVK